MKNTTIEAQTAIVGGGISGALSAIILAREGVDTLLIRKGYGATAMSSGCISSAGFSDWLALRGIPSPSAQIEQAFRTFGRLMEEMSLPFTASSPNESAYLTISGTKKRAELLPFSNGGGSLETLVNGSTLIVGIEGLKGFNVSFLSKALRHYLGEGTSISEQIISLPFLKRRANFSQPELALLLDNPKMAGDFIATVSAQIKDDFTHVLFPPILGMDKHLLVMTDLQLTIRALCVEAIAKIPSSTGIRLQKALNRALSQSGVRILHGCIDAYQQQGDKLTSVQFQDKAGQKTVKADSFILTSGSFIGGGLSYESQLREEVFGLPVQVKGENSDSAASNSLLNEGFSARQPLLSAGIEVDESFHPVDRSGIPLWSNLRAAGSVIASPVDSERWSGLGFGIGSGYLAALSTLSAMS